MISEFFDIRKLFKFLQFDDGYKPRKEFHDEGIRTFEQSDRTCFRIRHNPHLPDYPSFADFLKYGNSVACNVIKAQECIENKEAWFVAYEYYSSARKGPVEFIAPTLEEAIKAIVKYENIEQKKERKVIDKWKKKNDKEREKIMRAIRGK